MKQLSSTAVIVHWGDPRPTIEVALLYSEEGYFSKVVVVANDLSACPRELRKSAVSWIIPHRNLGFGGGCNLGGRLYQASKYAFLNADVTFHPGAIPKCLDALDLPGVGISAPTLYFPDGGLQSGCGFLSRRLKIPRPGHLPAEAISECEWVTGASLFCRHEIFESIGFDGSYFLSFEDLDISYRARLAGWKVVVLAGASATHPGRTTLNGCRPIYYRVRNQIWFSRRNGSLLGSFGATIYLLRTAPRILLADVVKRRSSHMRLMCHGIIDGWSEMPATREPLLTEPIPSRWIDWLRN